MIWFPGCNATFTRIHGKSGISIIPPGMAEKTRKCGRIPPKAEWLACLELIASNPARIAIDALPNTGQVHILVRILPVCHFAVRKLPIPITTSNTERAAISVTTCLADLGSCTDCQQGGQLGSHWYSRPAARPAAVHLECRHPFGFLSEAVRTHNPIAS